ncbi:uncharacterized protein LOC133528303 isoform X1 [Cydia pomonella]|uniref:uncharacterized protein LOC133528303 isoform X1 n=1 Tax=Cydia pomonella TaxID=82600 RepID=UPI002ADDD6A3|nr:uncharacterized protein LOC133528303 isoform X1 [Cydia pomonella]XP_061721622.1 uncharacterized protein LOC133528303 isoform X1 [Cydia pomonella]XP_061721623.1 uncharacterized protein LOC133528303 isoform X1 [Cydia pomonella]XP_061721624.1 uncharacterized protein LOC133528303 isoform X1 [Cydia pomonella]XP_061721625.1 uncharacterized protein LOC133528303 isoform X1 [Cydia pomonella]
MDQQTELHNDHDPNIINCDDIPDTISITSTPEKLKKTKKKRKRKINIYNMDNLIITKKLKLKKKKNKCVLSVNTYEECSGSIVRSAYNVCRKDAYHKRIVPICLRDMCSDISSCCRSTLSREYRNPNKSLSSIALTDVFACNNLSYEDVSNGSFSSDSEELDTLIKRTKQRERQINHFYPAREYTSTPLSKIEYIPTPSPYSIDTDKKSIHSDTTMELHPLSEAYSPTTSLDAIHMENDVANDRTDINLPYSSTMIPDLIKMGNMDYSPVKNIGDDNVPYSPTFTPESIAIDHVPSRNMNAPSIFSSVFVKMENLDNITTSNNLNGNEKSSTMTPGLKMEKPNSSNINDSFNMNTFAKVRYSPSSPTLTPDFHKFAITTQMNTKNNPNVANSAITAMIKQGNINEYTINNYTNSLNSSIFTEDLIKREPCEEYNDHSSDTEDNMNNTIHCKNEKMMLSKGDTAKVIQMK